MDDVIEFVFFLMVVDIRAWFVINVEESLCERYCYLMSILLV